MVYAMHMRKRMQRGCAADADAGGGAAASRREGIRNVCLMRDDTGT